MHVLITGGGGFLARHVTRALRAVHHDVTVVSRRPGELAGRAIGWDEVPAAMPAVDAIVNLAGASLTHRRWRDARKRELLDSRLESTRLLLEAVAATRRRPTVLVNGSAAAIYGPRGDVAADETTPPGAGFVAEVYRRWEDAAARGRGLGLRVVPVRFGTVLGEDGGVLPRMRRLYRAGLGGRLGAGTQWMSWIHRDDAVAIVLRALSDATWDGPVNAVAATPVRQRDFATALAAALRRPAVLRVPAVVLRAVLGEMATILLTGQRAVPAALVRAGWAYRHPELPAALAASLR